MLMLVINFVEATLLYDYQYTRNTSDYDQSNNSSRIVFPTYLLNLVKPEIASFDPPTPKAPP